jgi:hypothetical protein
MTLGITNPNCRSNYHFKCKIRNSQLSDESDVKVKAFIEFTKKKQYHMTLYIWDTKIEEYIPYMHLTPHEDYGSEEDYRVIIFTEISWYVSSIGVIDRKDKHEFSIKGVSYGSYMLSPEIISHLKSIC